MQKGSLVVKKLMSKFLSIVVCVIAINGYCSTQNDVQYEDKIASNAIMICDVTEGGLDEF